MKARLYFGLGVSVCLFMLAGSAIAHHSFEAEFDRTKPVTLEGTVTKVEWTNPHIWFYFDVRDANGTVSNWGAEGGPPNVLYRNGWRRDSMKVGDKIKVEGTMARDGSKRANAVRVAMADGRRLFAGSSGGDTLPTAPAPTTPNR